MIKKLLLACLLFSSLNAEAFLVSDTAGKRVDIQNLAGDGRWMVVMIWQLQCELCEIQKPTVEAFHNKYKQNNAHVVGLVRDGHESMPAIKQFLTKKPTEFPSHVVFGDVFDDQIKQLTGKAFHAAPGYLIYSPDGELVQAIDSRVNIADLVAYLENQF